LKYKYLPALALSTTVAACAVDSAPTEGLGRTAEAVGTSGVAATLSVRVTDATYTATLTVRNDTAEPQSNWQVVVNMGPTFGDPNKSLIHATWLQPSGAAAVDGAFFNDLGNSTLFVPTETTSDIPAGGSRTISWTGDWNGTAPAVVSVDGVASGVAGAGNPADGVDPIALSSASAALRIAYDYEKGKLPNDGDPNYTLYDQTLWAAHSFRLAAGNSTIEFDPTAAGYEFVPPSVKADLAFAQLDPSVASYLAAGLVSCFSVTDGRYMYGFRADFLQSFHYPNAQRGSVTNGDGSVDTFAVSGGPLGPGQETITVNASSGPKKPDSSFGILRILPNFASRSTSKFVGTTRSVGNNPSWWHGRYAAACSPFNGPGGSTNPYLVVSQNGKGVAAWVQQVGVSCQNGCTGKLVVDPIPYSEPGAYYDVWGSMIGTESNPFTIFGSLYATSDHAGEWATRTINGVQQWGTFSVPVNILGTTEYKYVARM
jgi:hypothetical protein